MKIFLDNKTVYRDEDIRAIVHGACKAAGVGIKILKLTVTSTKYSNVNGYAYIPHLGRTKHRVLAMRLRVPPPGTEFAYGSFAQVALHEAMHLAGARHKHMTEEQHNCRMPVPWAEGLLLRAKDPEPKTDPAERRAAARADRAEHAREMLRKAQTRAKRADTILKKWKRRVAAMERP